MKFKLSGFIKSLPKVQYGGQECYGLTRANKDKFRIYISEKSMEDSYVWAETILHELLHLYCFILIGSGVKRLSSESKQHEFLEQVIPIILSRLNLLLKRNQKR